MGAAREHAPAALPPEEPAAAEPSGEAAAAAEPVAAVGEVALAESLAGSVPAALAPLVELALPLVALGPRDAVLVELLPLAVREPLLRAAALCATR